MGDATRLGQELERLEQEDPEIRAAVENYERVTREILDTPPFKEENMAPLDELNLKLAKHHLEDSPSLELSPAEARRISYTLWEKRKLERETSRNRLMLAFASLLNSYRGETVLLNELALLTDAERDTFDHSIAHIRERAVSEHARAVKSWIQTIFDAKSLDCPKDPPVRSAHAAVSRTSQVIDNPLS